MVQLKFLILDSMCGKAQKEALETVGKSLKINLTTRLILNSKGNGKIPRDYDGYLLHLSDTSKERIIELREAQPWCKIFGMSLANDPNLTCLDESYFITRFRDFEYMLGETASIYQKKK
jgi:hypothetical protein